MRIVSCYIKKFGALENKTIGFNDGLNLFTRHNGWGKSTLCDFIKAMLYGMEKTSRTQFTEREKYLAYGSGSAGGNLVFEKDGRTYRIERTFYSKEKDDEFALYEVDSGKESKAWSKQIGEELFELDKDSFERTLFINRDKTRLPKNTVSISSHINGLLENEGDLSSFDSVMAALEKDILELKSLRGSSSTRVLDRLEMEIRQKEMELSDCLDAEKKLVSGREELKKLNETVKKANAQNEEAQKQLLERQRLEKVRKGNPGFVILSVFFLLVFFLGVYASLVILKKPAIIMVLAMLPVLALANFFILSVQKKNINALLEKIPEEDALISMMAESGKEKDESLVGLGAKEKELGLLLEKAEKISEIKDEIVYLKESYALAQDKLRILKLTKSALEKAKETLDGRYSGKIRKRFERYGSLLEGERKFIVNDDLDLLEDKNGNLIPFQYFSEGYKDLLALCLRLSLIDCIFEEEKPFIVLDDPFVNLDDEKQNLAMHLIESKGKDCQVLLFKAR